jgi:hypothetical protein
LPVDGRTAKSFEFGSGFGQESIAGLLINGSSNDVVKLPLTIFKDLGFNHGGPELDVLMCGGGAVQSGET